MPDTSFGSRSAAPVRLLTAENAPLWEASTYPPEAYTYVLDDREVGEIRAALEIAQTGLAGRDLLHDRSIVPVDFPLPRLDAILGLIAGEVADGRGFAVLRGVPVDGCDERACTVLLRGLVAHLGAVATQSRDGQLVRHVRSTGQSLGNATTRGHETAARLWFHTDGADAAVLLCRRAAAAGGLSRLASAAVVHNLMAEQSPELLPVLYEPFHFHMAGGNVPDLPPTFVSPIFSQHDGRFSCRYVRHTLLETPAVTGVPLSRTALAAFDKIEELAEQVCVEMELLPGDLQLVNNHTVLHSRTAYEDPPDPEQARHLLRSWLTFVHYRGRRPSIVDEGLRYGWLTDELQRQAAATWSPPRSPSDPAPR
jgi:hypothetical protein